MGFTAVTIVAPNVPDGADPLTYFTAKPRDKAQELAQSHAQAAGLALFGGVANPEAGVLNEDAEDADGSTQPAAEKVAPSLTVEEKQAAQDAKTCFIPDAASVKPATSQNFDYAYLFPNARTRGFPQLLGEGDAVDAEATPRSTSLVAGTPAPTMRPTLQEMMEEPPYKLLRKAAQEYGKYGIVKIVPPRGFPRDRLPFGQDSSGFKCEKQVFVTRADAEAFNERALRKGFFRALLRFHVTTPLDKGKRRIQKLPAFERKPVDLYRLFRSVRSRGGLEQVVKRKEWAQVGRELGYASQALPTLSSTLRQAYVRAIQPFEAFLEQNGVVLLPNVLPRLDVEGEDGPAKPRSGVRVLPNGIIVESQENNVVTQDRAILTLDEGRNQGPSVTLKSFRQKSNLQAGASANLSLAEREALYWRLPAYLEVEHSAGGPGVPVLPFPEAFAANPAYSPLMKGSSSPWDLSRLPLDDDALARFVHEDIDDLIVPKLHIGQQFATQDWHTAPMAAYTMSILVEGAPRTWYTSKNVFTDQHAGEFILVLPDTRTMNWCHGYSVSESASLFPGFDWLTRVLDENAMTRKQEFCIQRLIYEASHSSLRPDSQRQIIEAIQLLRQREKTLTNQLAHLKRAHPDPASASQSITCAVTGAKRFWSWVLVNGETWSPEAALQRESSQAEMVFVRRYSDVDDYFDRMVSSVLAKSGAIEAWRQSVLQSLRAEKLPTETALQDLARTVPDLFRDSRLSAFLIDVVRTMHKWLHLQSSKKPRKQDELRVAYNEMIGCVDDSGEVEAARQRLQEEDQSDEEFWNGFIASLNAGDLPDAAAHSRLEALAARYPTIKPFIQLLYELVDWAKTVVRHLLETPVAYNTLSALKEQGVRLNVPPTSSAMRAIDHQLQWEARTIADVERFLTEPGAFDGVAIRYYKEKIDLNSLPYDTRHKFSRLVYDLPLIDRMTAAELSKRPRQGEAEVLQAFPAFAYAMNILTRWLADAQALDWLFILGQLQRLTTSAPSAPVAKRVSTSQLMLVRRRMYELKIVPDDIELVQKTIEDAARTLEVATPQSRAAYGFDP